LIFTAKIQLTKPAVLQFLVSYRKDGAPQTSAIKRCSCVMKYMIYHEIL